MRKPRPPKKKSARQVEEPPVLTKPVAIGPWNFHERSQPKKKVITQWIEETHWSKGTRAQFDRAIDQLRHLPKIHWSKPSPASNIGDHTYVIRFRDVTSAQLRVYGHFFDDHHAFAMTLEGYEKGDEYYPKNYESLVQDYRAYCDADFTTRTAAFEDLCAVCDADKEH